MTVAGPCLIVNADDFGLSSGVNSGIVLAHREGILTSATLLANAPGFDAAAAAAAANPSLGVGLHLNLVRGRPLSPPAEIPLLTGPGGHFRRFRLARLTPAFLAQAEREYRRQFEKILAAGIHPTHIDFEKHHAWQGGLYCLACRLAREYGVQAARNLHEPVAWGIRRIGWPGLANAAMAAFLRTGTTLSLAGGVGLARPDRLLGQTHIGRMFETAWLRLLASPPPGISEVMTHPGQVDAGGEARDMGESWIARAREQELAALLSPAVKRAARESGVRLIHFGQLP